MIWIDIGVTMLLTFRIGPFGLALPYSLDPTTDYLSGKGTAKFDVFDVMRSGRTFLDKVLIGEREFRNYLSCNV